MTSYKHFYRMFHRQFVFELLICNKSGEVEKNLLGMAHFGRKMFNPTILILTFSNWKKILVLFDLFTLLTGKKSVDNNFLTAWKMMRFCSKGGVMFSSIHISRLKMKNCVHNRQFFLLVYMHFFKKVVMLIMYYVSTLFYPYISF